MKDTVGQSHTFQVETKRYYLSKWHILIWECFLILLQTAWLVRLLPLRWFNPLRSQILKHHSVLSVHSFTLHLRDRKTSLTTQQTPQNRIREMTASITNPEFSAAYKVLKSYNSTCYKSLSFFFFNVKTFIADINVLFYISLESSKFTATQNELRLISQSSLSIHLSQVLAPDLWDDPWDGLSLFQD